MPSSSSSSSSAGAGPCEPFDVDVHGRQGIGVTQPESGTDYPLVSPTEDVRYLLADLYMSFDQPSDYRPDVEPLALPFHIEWLYGFGCIPPDFPIPTFDSSSSAWSSICSVSSNSLSSNSSEGITHDCMPIPRNAHDIVIVDATGRRVFDSTKTDITYAARDWGPRLRVVEWRDPSDAVVRLTYHTAWSPNDDPEPRNYPVYFFPTDATLDERSVEQLPKRVRSLTVVLDQLAKTAVDFNAGYNMLLQTGETSEVDGKRRTTRITFNATPGAGAGVFPGCEPEQLITRRINGVAPTADGDFFMAATDCYYIRQPTRLLNDDPRETLPQSSLLPGSVPTPGLPDPLAGTAKNLPGWPVDDDPRYAHLQFGNDCDPCCDCEDYVEVAQYMNRQRNRYHIVGTDFEDHRDIYHDNRERWLNSLDCFLRYPLRIKLLPQICPFLDIAIQFCNQSDECKLGVELSVTFTTSPTGGEGVEVPGYTFITGASRKQGRTSVETDRYQMGGEWPTFTAYFDSVQPSQSVNARFRLRFDENCGMLPFSSSSSSGSSSDSDKVGPAGQLVGLAVEGCLTGTIEGEPIEVSRPDGGDPFDSSSSSSAALMEAKACDEKTLNCPSEDDQTVNLLICQCET